MQITESWYTELIEELKNIITEKTFTARWEIVEGWHSVGKRILQDEENFTKGGYTQDGIVATVAASLGRSPRSIEYAIQFVRKFPDLNLLPEGKDTSLHRIYNKYLPKPTEKQKEDYLVCVGCGSEIMPIKVKCEHCSLEFEITKDEIRRR